jgi:hypothetical protein
VPPAHLAAAEAAVDRSDGGEGAGDGGGEGESTGPGGKVLGKLAPRSEQAEAARKRLEEEETARKIKAAAKLKGDPSPPTRTSHTNSRNSREVWVEVWFGITPTYRTTPA